MKSEKIIRIVIVVLILVLCVCFAVIFLRQKNNNVQPTETPSVTESTVEPTASTTESTALPSTEPSETQSETALQPEVTDAAVTNPETGRIIVNVDTENWNLVVVNSTREFAEGYEPQLDQIFDTGKYLDARVAPHYEEMYTAAKQDGIILTPYSAYRSYERQKNNYNHLTETYMSDYNLSRAEAAEKAATVILPPGTSEHNLGLCMDICNVFDSFVNQPEYQWLTEHAHEYGFILRYPKGKEDVTGIVFEPWHWRYVGVEWAKTIRDSGLCLEEYLDSVGIAY